MKTKINLQLSLAVLILAVLPWLTSYFLVGDIVEKSIDLGFSPKITETLNGYQDRLKELRDLKPEKTAEYRKDFDQTRQLMAVYQDPELIRATLKRTLFTYYAVGIGGVLFMALGVSVILSRRIARTFAQTLSELLAQRERLRHLEEIAQWQEVAKKLAHEIKGPLTPIEMMVSALPRSFDKLNRIEFESLLQETRQMVSEEVGHLRKMVHSFSAFSKLPEASLRQVCLKEFFAEYVAAYADSWPTLSIEYQDEVAEAQASAQIDPGLIRQVIMVLLNNAAEINQGRATNVRLLLSQSEDAWTLSVYNDGKAIPPEDRERIFQVYYSTKHSRDHMGLGLAIAKKILLDHAGDIRCADRNEGAEFLLSVPRMLAGGGKYA